MTAPLDLDGPPACPDCGAPMTVTEWPGEGPDGASLWSASCIKNGEYHWEWFDRPERPTWRTGPGCAALVAEIERLRSDLSLRADEMDRLCAELDRADPHAMTLLQHAVDRLEAERQSILDAGGDFLWAGGAKTLPEAVAGVLHALDVALTRSANEYDRSPTVKARETIPSLALTDADVVRRAVEQAGRLEYRMRRVSAVDAALSCGDDVAAALCRACGLDPNEMVGDDGEGEE